jgi:alkyldihydroxyacetonephosphate synthase
MTKLRETSSGAIDDLRRELGDHAVSTLPMDRLANSRGVWPVEIKLARRAILGEGEIPLPGCVVSPRNTSEASAVLQIAQHWQVPVVPFGGGSGIVGGASPLPGCISLDTKHLTALRIDGSSMVAYAGAGIFGIDLERQLNQRGLSLGHFPQSFYSSTVGGWVATRASGTFSTLHGNIEDRVIGVQVALPGGALLSTRPSPRSATGPDLAQVFLGSEGTLGVITEVALWLHRSGQPQILQSYLFPTFEDGLEAVRRFVQSGARPGVVRLYDAVETAHKFPGFGFPEASSVLLLVFEGEPEIVDGHVGVVDRICANSQGEKRGTEPVKKWWKSRFETGGLVAANSRAGGFADAIEVAALWSDLKRVYDKMVAAGAKHHVSTMAHVSHVYPSGAGLYMIIEGSSVDDAAAIEDYTRTVGDLLQACLEHGGSVSHHHGIGRGKVAWLVQQQGQAGMAILGALKRQVDPAGIMNPGVLGLGV